MIIKLFPKNWSDPDKKDRACRQNFALIGKKPLDKSLKNLPPCLWSWLPPWYQDHSSSPLKKDVVFSFPFFCSFIFCKATNLHKRAIMKFHQSKSLFNEIFDIFVMFIPGAEIYFVEFSLFQGKVQSSLYCDPDIVSLLLFPLSPCYTQREKLNHVFEITENLWWFFFPTPIPHPFHHHRYYHHHHHHCPLPVVTSANIQSESEGLSRG